MSDLSQTFGHEHVEAAARESRIRSPFEAVACGCDMWHHLTSLGVPRGWKCRLATMAAPAPGQFFVDLAGGTGDVAYRNLGLAMARKDVGTKPQAAAR